MIIKIQKRRKCFRILILMLCPLLASCGGEAFTFKAVTAGIAATANDVFARPDANLKEKNYAAADYLESLMNGYVSKTDLIVLKPLEETDHPGITSELGMSMSEEIGLRFLQLGYRVSLSEVAQPGVNEGLYKPLASSVSPDYILAGSYLRGATKLDVHLRIVQQSTGQIIAVFDYALPLTREIKEKSQTQTRIFRVE